MNEKAIATSAVVVSAIGVFLFAMVHYQDQIMSFLFKSQSQQEETKTQAPASQYIPQNAMQNIQGPAPIPSNFCPYCGQYFTTQELLQKHIMAVHNKVEYPRPAIYSSTPIAYIQGQPFYGP